MRFRLTLLLIIGIFIFSGCAGILNKLKGTDSPKPLESQIILRFTDIPVPNGFKLISQDSYTFESGGVRVGVLKYKGRGITEQIVSFYKDQMPLYNWSLLNVIGYGEILLNFDRDSESCIVRIIPKGRSITINISLGPKVKTTPKKADKPIK